MEKFSSLNPENPKSVDMQDEKTFHLIAVSVVNILKIHKHEHELV